MKELRIRSIDEGQRADKYLLKVLPEMPKSLLYKMLRKKNIKLNGSKIEGNEMLAAGDLLNLYFTDEALANFGFGVKSAVDETASQATVKLDVIYEDRNLLLVNKPAGILSQPGEQGVSIVEAIDGYLAEKLGKNAGGFRAGICNRLDMNTSGLVISGKSVAALQALNDMIAEHKVVKTYHCILAGELTEQVELKGYLVKDPASNKVSISEKAGKGSLIETRIRPLAWTKGYTLCEVELITGKTHQIRAHLSYIGYPIIGDMKYGDEKLNKALRQRYGIKRQMLHAYSMTFRVKEGLLANYYGQTFKAPYPRDFDRIKKKLFE